MQVYIVYVVHIYFLVYCQRLRFCIAL